MTDDHITGYLENPGGLIDETVSELDAMQAFFVDGAMNVAQARDILKQSQSVWKNLAMNSASNPALAATYVSGLNTIMAVRDEIRAQRVRLEPFSPLPRRVMDAASLALTTTAGTASAFDVDGIPMSDMGFLFNSEQSSAYEDRFSRFDPSLGKTYKEIREVLWGTRADPERAALWEGRQVLDHLFGKLAPDDEVTRSEYWKPKVGDRPNLVTREERIQFAAARYVRDETKARILVASSKNILDVYEALNVAHKRGPLDESKARSVLVQLLKILEEWADAIGI
jgi:hypothetical protein